jgi:hypothetical protein
MDPNKTDTDRFQQILSIGSMEVTNKKFKNNPVIKKWIKRKCPSSILQKEFKQGFNKKKCTDAV